MAISNLTSGMRPGVCTSTTRPTTPYKTCSTCKLEQSIENFSKDKTQPTGLNYQCKSCRRKVNMKSLTQKKVATDTHQTCTMCQTEKPIDQFYKDPRGRNGRHSRCKVCHNQIAIANHRKNPESQKLAAQRWRKRNKDKVRIANSAIKARRRKSERKIFTKNDWQGVLRRYNNSCAYCGCAGNLTVDHVVPLARGGRHAVGNIVPACRSCNSSKNDRFIVEWRKAKWL